MTEPRTNTPDRITTGEDGNPVANFHLKRCCNGCGIELGDLVGRDVDDNGDLADVRAECLNCAPLVGLEAAGCKTWQVTERSFTPVADEIDRLRPWVYTKGYWRTVDGETRVVGLRVGSDQCRVVAYFGDWIIRHPDGRWSVHKGPAGGDRHGA